MFLNKHNTLYERQFSFRDNYSTTHALLDITEKIRQGYVVQVSTPEGYYYIYKKLLIL